MLNHSLAINKIFKAITTSMLPCFLRSILFYYINFHIFTIFFFFFFAKKYGKFLVF